MVKRWNFGMEDGIELIHVLTLGAGYNDIMHLQGVSG